MPSGPGARSATLTLTDKAATPTQDLALSGNGVPADAGPQGQQGLQGSSGGSGSDGAPGPRGPRGAPGPKGDRGVPGRDSVVTCKVQKLKGSKVKVTCTVKKAKGKSRVAVRLSRAGRTLATGSGTLAGGKVAKTLAAKKRVPGSYTLSLSFTAGGATTKRSMGVLVG